MTAAMAFFTIALTLNLTGVRLSTLRLADLRPTAVRSFMERRLTMASTPIIRYYDHLRFVYEVESRMRELRRTEGEDSDNDKGKDVQHNPPGQSKQNPGHKEGGSRVDPPQQSVTPANNDFDDSLELSLTSPSQTSPSQAFQAPTFQERAAQSGSLTTAIRERSTQWTA